jgi:hypothetical protein
MKLLIMSDHGRCSCGSAVAAALPAEATMIFCIHGFVCAKTRNYSALEAIERLTK